MTGYIADSCAWIAYFDHEQEFKELIEGNDVKTPSVAVAEITRVLARRSVALDVARKALDFVFKHSIILELDFKQAVKAGELAVKEKLHLSDAIVYSYASEDDFVLTSDPHFQGKPFVKFI